MATKKYFSITIYDELRIELASLGGKGVGYLLYQNKTRLNRVGMEKDTRKEENFKLRRSGRFERKTKQIRACRKRWEEKNCTKIPSSKFAAFARKVNQGNTFTQEEKKHRGSTKVQQNRNNLRVAPGKEDGAHLGEPPRVLVQRNLRRQTLLIRMSLTLMMRKRPDAIRCGY